MERRFEIIDGPDKPEMLWSLEYPDREQSVQFKTQNSSIEVIITRMDELADGLSFTLQGTVSSGDHKGKSVTGAYSVGHRRGALEVMG